MSLISLIGAVLALIAVWFGIISIFLYVRGKLKGPLFLFTALVLGWLRIAINENGGISNLVDLLIISFILVGAILLGSVENQAFLSILKHTDFRGILFGRFNIPNHKYESISFVRSSWMGISITTVISITLLVLGVNMIINNEDKFEAYAAIIISVCGILFVGIQILKNIKEKRN